MVDMEICSSIFLNPFTNAFSLYPNIFLVFISKLITFGEYHNNKQAHVGFHDGGRTLMNV